MPGKRSRGPMSTSHKQALAEGRELGRAVRLYLEAMEQNRPKRGRKQTPDSIKKRLVAIDEKLASAGGTTRLQLIQERIELQDKLKAADSKVDLSELEKDFIKSANGYGEKKNISYAAWREAGVSAEVLKKASIGRAAN